VDRPWTDGLGRRLEGPPNRNEEDWLMSEWKHISQALVEELEEIGAHEAAEIVRTAVREEREKVGTDDVSQPPTALRRPFRGGITGLSGEVRPIIEDSQPSVKPCGYWASDGLDT